MNTRKKVIKTVFKDENDSEDEGAGDFSDSGSEAKISEESSSEDEEDEEPVPSSGDEFTKSKHKSSKPKPAKPARKPKFAKNFVKNICKQSSGDNENLDVAPALFSVKDLTDADKLLPSVLNLSESGKSFEPNYSLFFAPAVI